MRKHSPIAILFLLVFLFFLQTGWAHTACNNSYANHSVLHSKHDCSATQVRKCNLPGKEFYNITNSSHFFAGTRKKFQFGKRFNIVYGIPVVSSHHSFHTIFKSIPHRPVLSMLILFPFHAFW